MSSTIGYSRASTTEQDTGAHRANIEQTYRLDKWFEDGATSGTTTALDRPGFSALFTYIREGDTLVVPAIDRLGA